MLDYSNSDRILAEILIEHPELRPRAIDRVAGQITADFLKAVNDYHGLMTDIADSVKDNPVQSGKYQALAELARATAERMEYIQQDGNDPAK